MWGQAVLKLALPAGDLRKPVARFLTQAGLRIAGYAEGSRSYRLSLDAVPAGRQGSEGVTVRVFREKDIPIQIALGNYDVGVCGLAWVEEFLARYPRQAVVKVSGLGVSSVRLFIAAAPGTLERLEDAGSQWGIRIASEYPNLAEAFALAARLPGYRIVPVWGAAEVYPPEDADLALIAAEDERDVEDKGLVPLHELLAGSAWLIANRESLRAKDLSPLLASLSGGRSGAGEPRLNLPPSLVGRSPQRTAARREQGDKLRLALPDGHQQRHVTEALRAAGLAFAGYGKAALERRPRSALEGLDVKVIRPQDMPQLVASGNFDLAITGRDCLFDHLYRFPSSPVEIAVDLQQAPFSMCAVVSADLPVESLSDALQVWAREGHSTLRLASEFVNIADHFARSNHFWRYRVIPTAGASEGFVPEDADLLIEGTETGQTLAENRLKPIETLFRSTTCVIVRKGGQLSGRKGQLLGELLGLLRQAAPESSATIEARG